MKKKGTELDEGTRKREVLHSNKSALDKRFDRNVVRTTREGEVSEIGVQSFSSPSLIVRLNRECECSI